MIRYLKGKPVNWAACLLVCGWMAACCLLLVADGDRVISRFRPGLTGEPLAWWPTMSFTGFCLIGLPLVLGAVALWLMPRLNWSPRASIGLVGAGAAAFVAGCAWDAGSGVALYPDRLVHRSAGFGRPIETEMFTDIRRTESSCLNVRQRGSITRKPKGGLTVVFGDGGRFEVWNTGLGWADRQQNARFPVVELIFEAAGKAGAIRAPQRGADGRIAFDSGCPARLAERLGVSVQRVSSLLVVDQSELKSDEYVVSPET